MRSKLTPFEPHAFFLPAALAAFSCREPSRLPFQASSNLMQARFLSIEAVCPEAFIL